MHANSFILHHFYQKSMITIIQMNFVFCFVFNMHMTNQKKQHYISACLNKQLLIHFINVFQTLKSYLLIGGIPKSYRYHTKQQNCRQTGDQHAPQISSALQGYTHVIFCSYSIQRVLWCPLYISSLQIDEQLCSILVRLTVCIYIKICTENQVFV